MDNTASEEGDGALVDEAMLGMGEFVSQMTDVDGDLADAETGTALRVAGEASPMAVGWSSSTVLSLETVRLARTVVEGLRTVGTCGCWGLRR